MKIAIISPSSDHLREMRATLEADGHSVACVEGGKSRMRAVAERERPQLMVVDGMCCDPGEITQMEYVGAQHPEIAVVLLCATQTPEFLITAMRAGVREVLPSPATPVALRAAVARVAAKLAGARTGSTGKVVAFMSCKGGCGATFLATNVAYQLAQSRSVLLVDLNLQFGDALYFVHDTRPQSTIADVARDFARFDASFLAASTVKVTPKFSVLAAPEDLAEASEVTPGHIDAILATATAQYDFVVLDLCRWLDHHTIKALDRADRVYAVLQAGVPYVRNAVKLQGALRSLGYAPDKLEFIVNRHDRGGDVGLDQIRRSLGSAKVNTVANSYREVNAAINHGDPLSKVARSSAVTRELAQLADTLSPKPDEARGLFDRMFRRG